MKLVDTAVDTEVGDVVVGITEGSEVGILLGKSELGFNVGFPDGFEVGMGDGFEVGILDGTKDGVVDGIEDGFLEGIEDGFLEGIDDGFLDGTKDGVFDGIEVGFLEGIEDGFLDGIEDGFLDGIKDGVFDGIEVGFWDGFTVVDNIAKFSTTSSKYERWWDGSPALSAWEDFKILSNGSNNNEREKNKFINPTDSSTMLVCANIEYTVHAVIQYGLHYLELQTYYFCIS